uniref:ATP synthase subunit a n=1 Tax=Brasilocerus sp. 2 DTA-2012 TaxID=1176494 RepID=A0A0H3UL03_9COLE|nr:ATP synthase F0 subunit 6 [Brasilocerus sp. 2 DTA-2012]
MMTNLFSIFDPSNNMNYSLNWLTTIMMLMFIPLSFWSTPSRLSMIWLKMFSKLNSEIKSIMGNSKESKSKLFIISLFTLILLNNLLSMFPFIYPPTSQLAFSLSLALPVWLSLMVYSLTNNLIKFSAHLVPQNTPMPISPFMVLIETTSNIIRPITLSVRLSTNITAGHLIIELIGKMMESEEIMKKGAIIIMLLIHILEMMMAIIQAYVFSILATMYFKETY